MARRVPAPEPLRMEVVKITPELAADWLALNRSNRRLRRQLVARILRDIVGGHWKMTAEPIKFSFPAGEGSKPRLIDGQNRLTAMVEAGDEMPNGYCECVVVWGVEDDAADQMDTGQTRTIGDMLTMRETPNASALAAAVPYVWRWEHGLEGHAKGTPSHAEALDILDRYPSLNEGIGPTRWVADHLKVGHGCAIWLYYHFASIDSDDNETFWNRLTSGAELKEHDPIKMVRDKLLAMAGSPKKWEQHQTKLVQALLIKAWNFYREGKLIDRITFSPGGVRPEKWPVAI